MTSTLTPAVWYARIFGIVLTVVGILGLIVNAEQETLKSLMGFDVNLTHNIVHLATGLIGVGIGFWMLANARIYALVLGIVYAALGIWGLVSGETFNPFDLFVNINMADNVLHLAIGIVGIAAWAMSRTEVEERVV